MTKLTDSIARNVAKAGLHADGAGLYLAVTPKKDGTFSRSWVARFTAPDGRRREMGLGSYPEITLVNARRAAAAKREMARSGTDPIEADRAVRAAAAAELVEVLSFKQCAEAYVTTNDARWRSRKHAKQWRATLKSYAYPTIGDRAVRDIDTTAITAILDKIWSTKPETARRVRGRIEAILDWAAVRGHRTGENPARWRGHLDKAMPVVPKALRVKHHAALPYDDLPKFMVDLAALEGSSARALEFAILTAARTGEVLGATWSEVDLQQKTWTIPAARMKAHRDHRVPLSQCAVDLLNEIKGDSEDGERPANIFIGPDGKRALSNMAMLMALRRMGRGNLTTHGFRSTFRDWAAEKTTYSGDVAEAALAHVVGDRVEAAYRRGDLFEKRRRLMAAWSAYCQTELRAKAI